MTSKAVGRLAKIQRRMTAESYVGLSENNLWGILEDLRINATDIFIKQDPRHTAEGHFQLVQKQSILNSKLIYIYRCGLKHSNNGVSL